MVPGFDVRQRSMIILERLTPVFGWLGARLEENAREALDDAFGLLRGRWCFSRLTHLSSSYRSSRFNVNENVCLLEPGTLDLVGLNRRMPPFGFFVQRRLGKIA